MNWLRNLNLKLILVVGFAVTAVSAVAVGQTLLSPTSDLAAAYIWEPAADRQLAAAAPNCDMYDGGDSCWDPDSPDYGSELCEAKRRGDCLATSSKIGEVGLYIGLIGSIPGPHTGLFMGVAVVLGAVSVGMSYAC